MDNVTGRQGDGWEKYSVLVSPFVFCSWGRYYYSLYLECCLVVNWPYSPYALSPSKLVIFMFAYHSISIKARGQNYLLFHSYQKILSTLLQWYKSLLLKLLLCGRCGVREEENESQRVGTVEEEESEKGYRESEDLFDSSEKKNLLFKFLWQVTVFCCLYSVVVLS